MQAGEVAGTWSRAGWAALVWTLLVGLSVASNVSTQTKQVYAQALGSARANFAKDRAFRIWATEHGGVYVRPTDRTPPNPWLSHLKHRDVETTDGVQLTLMNPAYMLRQMMEEYGDAYGLRGRIVGIVTLNPNNAADDWERAAIRSFEAGASEALETVSVNGAEQLRLMKPFRMQEGCLPCHGHLGFKVGDVRGGIGVSVPLAPFRAASMGLMRNVYLSHLLVWFLGLVAIGLAMRHIVAEARHRAGVRAKEVALTAELAQRVRQLDAQSTRLLELDQLKDTFLATTSHELRTPLHGLIGVADALLAGAAGGLTSRQREEVGLVVSCGHRLARLVDALLDLTKLHKNALSLRRRAVVLDALATQVVKMVRPLLQPGVELRYDIPRDLPLLWGDDGRLQQILFNLLGNAAKFTRTGYVEISARQFKTGVVITVADSGPGIPESERERIFEPFEQVDSSASRGFEGTGLGLSICKKLVELHGSQITLHSEVDVGTRFSFEMSIAEPGAEIESPTALSIVPQSSLLQVEANVEVSQKTPTRPERIVVVEDDPVTRRVAVNRLRLAGFGVIEFASGIDAMSWIEAEGPPDLILLDVMMPGLSGLEVCTRLRRKYPADKLPILVLTAKDSDQDVREGFSSGASDYLAKPHSTAELLARVDFHLQLQSTNAANIALEAELGHARRLEALGRLTGGVAHDFNNLLTVICGYADLLADDLPGNECIERISEAASRGATLNSQLLSFSRKKVIASKLSNLNDLVKDSVSFVERLVGDDVVVHCELAGTSSMRVLSDADQFQQIILNLASNARDAMPGGGDLYIRTRVALDRADQEAWGVVEIEDSGVGMDEETQSRALEPYFTTKERGTGTGLGLASVSGIVAQLGGRVVLSSSPGQGTHIELWFPLLTDSANDSDGDSTGPTAPGADLGEGTTVLLVEDQEALRVLTTTILERAGVKVLAADNAATALKRWAEVSGQIDLLLTDIVMPGGSGWDLARELCERRSDLAVVFMSGYGAEQRRGFEGDAGVDILSKPFSGRELIARLSEALEAVRGGGDRASA